MKKLSSQGGQPPKAQVDQSLVGLLGGEQSKWLSGRGGGQGRALLSAEGTPPPSVEIHPQTIYPHELTWAPQSGGRETPSPHPPPPNLSSPISPANHYPGCWGLNPCGVVSFNTKGEGGDGGGRTAGDHVAVQQDAALLVQQSNAHRLGSTSAMPGPDGHGSRGQGGLGHGTQATF